MPLSLFDREGEIDALRAVVDGLARGRGSVTVIDAPPGLGKTALCDRAAGLAEEHGVEVLAGRATELQEQVPFGLARILMRVPPSDLAKSPDRGLATIEQLTLAAFDRVHGSEEGADEDRPHLLIVDDAQWVDRLSAAFLSHLIARTEDLPVAFLLATRSHRGAQGLIEELERNPRTTVLRPRPLGREGTAGLVREICGPGVAPPLVDACFEAAEGSPLMTRELARELAAAGPDADLETIRDAAPATVLRAVLSRLAGLGSGPAALAESVAILDGSGSLAVAAELAGLGLEAAEDAADALAAAGLLDPVGPLEFAQPLIGAAIRAEMGPFARARAHRRAAAVLLAGGEPVATVAAQLLNTNPAGEEETVARLGEAAELALGRGDPSVAARLLERALAEPPAEAECPRLMLRLAEAEALAGSPDSLSRFDAALALVDDPGERARACIALARAVHHSGDFVRAASIVDGAREALPAADPTEPVLEATWFASAVLEPTLRPELAVRIGPEVAAALDGRPPATPALKALVAVVLTIADGPIEMVERLALEAFALDPAVDDDSQGTALGFAGFALYSIDRLDPMRDAIAAAVVATEGRGAVVARSVALNNVAMRAMETGELEEAVRAAEASLDVYRFGWTSSPWSTPTLIGAHVARGDLAAAREALAIGESAGTGRPEYVSLLESRSILRLAEGKSEAALADALEAVRVATDVYGSRSARTYQGVRLAAEAAAAAGHREQARELADEAIRRGESAGTGRAIGTAHLAAGLVGDDTSTEHLQRAVDALAGSPARYPYARALLALGTVLARRGDAAAAEEPLREALELADEFGAEPLVADARRELGSIGRRPRRAARSGVDSLTPSERRVAELAADGLSTPQIAHRLFITRKTVESHLGQAYRKLGISGRRELPTALASPAAI